MRDETSVLTLPFLGERTYLQGTTLLEALLASRSDARDISFKLARPILSDRVEVSRGGQPSGEPCAARLTYRAAGGDEEMVEVRPLAPSARIGREAFPEQKLIALARFDGSEAVVDEPSPFTTIKTIVSLNKALLARLWQPPPPGQWLFARLDVAHYPVRFTKIAVCYRTRAAFAALTSDINVDDAPLGRVIFSWRTL